MAVDEGGDAVEPVGIGESGRSKRKAGWSSAGGRPRAAKLSTWAEATPGFNCTTDPATDPVIGCSYSAALESAAASASARWALAMTTFWTSVAPS